MDGNILLFKLYKIFHGPVRQGFIYVFHQTYSHSENVYEYASQHVEYFTKIELLSLEQEKRLSHHNLPMLFTIIKSSCHPSLSAPTDHVWSDTNGIRSKDPSKASVENLLVMFMHMYEEVGRRNNPLVEKEYNAKVNNVKLWLQKLVEGAGKFDVTGRWKEALERIMNVLQGIVHQNEFPIEDVDYDIKTELRMGYDLYYHKGINPLLLQLSIVPEIPIQLGKKKKHKHRKDPITLFDVADIVKTGFEDDCSERKKTCLIKGEPGIGRSNLAALLASSWNRKDNQIRGISIYDAVIILPGLMASVHLDIIKTMFPLCTHVHRIEDIKNWLLKAKILLVVDDAEEIDNCDDISNLIQETTNMDTIILTSPEHFAYQDKKLSDLISARLNIEGLGREQIMASAEQIMTHKKCEFLAFKNYLSMHLCRLELVLKYPVSLMETCDLWLEAPETMVEVTTSSDLLWALTMWKIDKALSSGLEIADNSKLKDWLSLAGSLTFQAYKDGTRLDKNLMEDLLTETSKLFVSMSGQSLFSLLFKQRFTHRGSNDSRFSALHNSQQEFFTAWYVANKIIDGKRLKDIYGHLTCPYHVAVYMCGLLPKIKDFKWISMLHERRLINAAVNHTEISSDDLNFNIDLVTEVKGLLKYVEVIVDYSEYPDEWNVDAGDIQIIPLESLLFLVAPTRIFLNVEELRPYSELQKVTSYLCKVQIFVWLDSSCQFEYGNAQKMDRTAKAFFGEHVRTRIDLLKGNVSNKVLKELYCHVAFTHLVFLKLRVTDMKTLVTILKLPDNLPKLLWLEIKLDFPVLEEDVSTIPRTSAPLMDVHLQKLDDTCVSKLANLLGAMHTYYSGIHLDNTSLTPEDVFVIFKQLQKRKVHLYSPPEYREKFRRWYYPQLSNFDKNIKLTDELALKVLGFDDRIYYSNHEVSSSCYSIALDAWNLASYLEEEENIIQFTFKSDNMTCIKGLDGTVNIMVNGICHNRKKMENGNHETLEIIV
ncbi:hypothetical protein SK128_016310 [Halocaridina rubra]|uniref:Uncharacterized protein n=1 Tax=Halocaridina rubra TaxID=373956 RepID=A0AAN8X9Z9_HALRR